MNCDFCRKEKKEKDLIDFGKSKICFLCKINQTTKPSGTVIKTKHGMQDNSYLS